MSSSVSGTLSATLPTYLVSHWWRMALERTHCLTLLQDVLMRMALKRSLCILNDAKVAKAFLEAA
jgi:hypothetical protein